MERPTAHAHGVPVARAPVAIPVDAAEIERQQAALNIVRFSGGEQPAVSTLINALLVRCEQSGTASSWSSTDNGNRTMLIPP